VIKRVGHLVVDLGFGDAGKGHLVDALVRHTGARWVVRFNGGAQAGHTVVLDDGRAHTFAQLGAGSFVPGVRTFLAAPVVIHPTALAVEAGVLAQRGVGDGLARLAVDARCRIITPYHQSANRLREHARGDARHGSCGVGVGETVADSLAHPDETITMAMLRDPTAVRPMLARTRERKREALRTAIGHGNGGEWRTFEDVGIAETWLARASSIAASIELVDMGAPAVWGERGDVVFEGAQGVLLDERFGFHPFTSPSTCTFANADAILDAWGWSDSRRRIGVLRSFHVRHGPGPLPSETDALDVLAEPHNVDGPWQGRFRRGWFDVVLARHAIEVCGGIDTLALTHLDALAHDLGWRIATSHDRGIACGVDAVGRVDGLEAIAGDDGEARMSALRRRVSDALAVPIEIASYGPRTSEVMLAIPR